MGLSERAAFELEDLHEINDRVKHGGSVQSVRGARFAVRIGAERAGLVGWCHMENAFSITAHDARSSARCGVLRTPHGDIPTPAFMPIGTCGAVKHVIPTELRNAGAHIILANTYHLMLRPGTDALAARGGLHRFMGWSGPILTDSGGFQVFSLGFRSASRGGVNHVALTEEGVRFRSHLDGSGQLLTPESALDHQRRIGSDIAMVLDVCPPQPCPPDAIRDAVLRTTRWAERSIAYAESTGFRDRGPLLFGIIQGGSDMALRRESAAAITALPFDGFAIGGVAVGETKADIRSTIERTAPLLPADRTRYLMGLGTPDDLCHAVAHGVDLFDCVLPTRDARHGRVYRWVDREAFVAVWPRSYENPEQWYTREVIAGARFRTTDAPIDPGCACPACATGLSCAYLRHLFAIGEPLGQRLLTLHNLTFYLDCVTMMRTRIESEGMENATR